MDITDRYGIDWDKAAKLSGQKSLPRISRLQYLAYHGIGDQYEIRRARIEALFPDYQWHRWNERRLRAVCDYR